MIIKEKSTIFCTDMVVAILDNLKTETRRLDGLKEINREPDNWEKPFYVKSRDIWEFYHKIDQDVLEIKSPYKVGDRLFVKESYCIESCSCRIGRRVFGYYVSDNSKFRKYLTYDEWLLWCERKFPFRKTSGRFMYKSLARIWLEILDVKFQRIQSISTASCKAEGVETTIPFYAKKPTDGGHSYKFWFKILWNSLNEKRGYGWDLNPYVWVVKFKRLISC